jgi:hypothetical protein
MVQAENVPSYHMALPFKPELVWELVHVLAKDELEGFALSGY